MPWRHIAVLCLAAIAGGCAAAMPGYQPPTPQLEKVRNAAPKGGGFDTAGNYRLTDQEQELDCKQINGSITIKIKQMRAFGGRGKPSFVASTAQAAARPVAGGTNYGQNLGEDYRRDRARLETLNRRLAEKKCATFDLDSELAPGNDKLPRPRKKS